jgi:hypothetical protein
MLQTPSDSDDFLETVSIELPSVNYTVCLQRQQYMEVRMDDTPSSRHANVNQWKDSSLLLYDSSSFSYHRTI